MSRLRDIANKVAYRAVQLMVESGYRLTFDQAQRKAAKQIATVEKLKPRQVRPVNTKARRSYDGFNAPDDPRRLLIHKLNEMASRIRPKGQDAQLTPRSAADAFPPKPLGQPTSEPKSGVLTRLIEAATGSKPQDDPKNPNAPPEPHVEMQLVYSGHSRVGVFDDNEFPARYRDPVTENWRRSLNQTPNQRQPSDDDLDVSSLQAICAAYDAQQKREKPDDQR